MKAEVTFIKTVMCEVDNPDNVLDEARAVALAKEHLRDSNNPMWYKYDTVKVSWKEKEN